MYKERYYFKILGISTILVFQSMAVFAIDLKAPLTAKEKAIQRAMIPKNYIAAKENIENRNLVAVLRRKRIKRINK